MRKGIVILGVVLLALGVATLAGGAFFTSASRACAPDPKCSQDSRVWIGWLSIGSELAGAALALAGTASIVAGTLASDKPTRVTVAAATPLPKCPKCAASRPTHARYCASCGHSFAVVAT